MKRILIKLFRLKHLESVIYRTMKKQQESDDKSHKREIGRIHEQHNQQIALMKQSYEAKIRMLNNTIIDWEAKERKMNDRTYKAEMQIQINYEVAHSIMKETSEITKNVGRLQGLYDKVELQNNELKLIEG